MTDHDALARLREASRLLEGLETGQDCPDYAFAKSDHFQAMTYAPEAFEALRCIPSVITLIEQQAAEIARLRALLTEAVERVAAGDLDQRMCCDGHMCVCQGSTNADQFLHYARQALKGQP